MQILSALSIRNLPNLGIFPRRAQASSIDPLKATSLIQDIIGSHFEGRSLRW